MFKNWGYYFKCYKRALIQLIVSIVLDVLSISILWFSQYCSYYNIVLAVYYIIVVTTIVIVVLSTVDIIFSQKDNKRIVQEGIPYGFDRSEELSTYKSVGSKRKQKKIIKNELQTYLEWKKHITDFLDERNWDNDKLLNFYKYLNLEKRRANQKIDAIKAILVPLYIGCMTTMIGSDMLFEVISSVIIITVISANQLSECGNEKGLFEDIMEIVDNRIDKKQV